MVADVAGDAHADAAGRVDRDQRLMVTVVDFREVTKLGCSQTPVRVQKTVIDRVVAALLHRRHERCLVAGLDRSNLELN